MMACSGQTFTSPASRRPIRTYERLGELSVTRDHIKRFRQLDSKCPGPLDLSVQTQRGPLLP